jgi:dynein heavy chain 2
MHQIDVFTPHISRSYGLKQFKLDLKTVMQQAGVEGKEIVLLMEDHQVVDPSFLELINSLLSSGEVSGLFTPEELEPVLAPLRDQMSQDGFRGTMLAYFASRVKANLHIALIMDSSSNSFAANCEANPAFYTFCSFQSMESWSRQSMLDVPQRYLQITSSGAARYLSKTKEAKRPLTGGDELVKAFFYIHESCIQTGNATPRNYITFLKTYKSVYESRKDKIQKRQGHLQAGVSKLNEATALVDKLKSKAAKQQALLAEKQAQADGALHEITASMQSATEQKNEMEQLKQKQSEERSKLEKRKKAIDIELSEIEPLIREAKKAVGNIKPETLSEIRALRAPPDTIRDILEGVLRLMGVFDTSWGSMRSFLAQRGVKEDIQSFDAHRITHEIRENVQVILTKNAKSFDAQVAKRASVAAAPLAAWVKANVKYSYVLEKIGPLEKEQNGLKENLEHSEERLAKLMSVLGKLDQKVKEMRTRFELLTTEAAKLKIDVEKEAEIIAAAENLVGKLEGEYKRWSAQVGELTKELEQLPRRAVLAAGFITYLSQAPEDQRRSKLSDWVSSIGVDNFNLRRFLSSESEQLAWKGEGLPSDDLSMENAMVILQSEQCPFLVDPSQRATEWLKTHLKESRLEVVNQQDSNFTTALELAVRFGKTLVIQEVDGVEPLLYPLLRRDLISQGPRFVVQLGDKTIDYNESFKLFLTTRNPLPDITPDAASIISSVNFTTTRSGLSAQLLANALQSEKPELEQRKTELLKTEEDLKVQLEELENSLLQELATAEGNILENKILLESLNLTKTKSLTIAESLLESQKLQASLDQERNSYLPLASYGSNLFFVISDLANLNNMYQFSLASFLRLFQRALQNKQDSGNTELRIRALTSSLLLLVYEYICQSLFKADRLMFALHLVHGMQPQLFQEKEWSMFLGLLVNQAGLRRLESTREMVPSWISNERTAAVLSLRTNLPTLYELLDLSSADTWTRFYKSSQCEREIPSAISKSLTHFQLVLLVQALRPDRLQTVMEQFATKVLGLKEVSPATLNLKRLYSKDSTATEAILVVISPGTDPSQEIQDLAESVVGLDRFQQVAMGQGQATVALQALRNCAMNGNWLCLKNLHLVTSWLPTLEKELNSLELHKNFRLWLTTEAHPRFPTVLLQSSLKVTYEAPPGIKKNLQRTYDTWSEDYVSQGNSVLRSQALFALAWFHAVVQERRCYIPQGWSKFYEFSLGDLRAGASIIDRLCKGSSK